ncbi:MAG: amidohydrolase family protein, partial [Frankia sp.]
MKANDMILVSVDDHLVEPRTLFEGRLASRFVDQAPKIVTNADGADVWVFNGTV